MSAMAAMEGPVARWVKEAEAALDRVESTFSHVNA
jgi:hypothetical protein